MGGGSVSRKFHLWLESLFQFWKIIQTNLFSSMNKLAVLLYKFSLLSTGLCAFVTFDGNQKSLTLVISKLSNGWVYKSRSDSAFPKQLNQITLSHNSKNLYTSCRNGLGKGFEKWKFFMPLPLRGGGVSSAIKTFWVLVSFVLTLRYWLNLWLWCSALCCYSNAI